LLVPENVAAAALDDAFCEEIAVQSIVDVQSYRIAAHIASNSCVDRLRTFSTASTFRLTGRRQRREATLLNGPLHGLFRYHAR
jgi:hypothetical protein